MNCPHNVLFQCNSIIWKFVITCLLAWPRYLTYIQSYKDLHYFHAKNKVTFICISMPCVICVSIAVIALWSKPTKLVQQITEKNFAGNSCSLIDAFRESENIYRSMQNVANRAKWSKWPVLIKTVKIRLLNTYLAKYYSIIDHAIKAQATEGAHSIQSSKNIFDDLCYSAE